jgi:hypothetical protein
LPSIDVLFPLVFVDICGQRSTSSKSFEKTPFPSGLLEALIYTRPTRHSTYFDHWVSHYGFFTYTECMVFSQQCGEVAGRI